MLKSLTIILLFYLCAYNLFAQTHTQELSITGILFKGDSLRKIKSAQVFLNSKYKTKTNSDGSFVILTKPGDTLVISSTENSLATIIIPDTFTQKNNIIGIFTGQNISLKNSIISYPRLNHYDIKLPAYSSAAEKSHETRQQALNNVANTKHQALKTDKEWDAEMNQKNAMKKFETSVEYKYMIAPDNMLMFTGIIPYAAKVFNKKENSLKTEPITLLEERLLINLFLEKNNLLK